MPKELIGDYTDESPESGCFNKPINLNIVKHDPPTSKSITFTDCDDHTIKHEINIPNRELDTVILDNCPQDCIPTYLINSYKIKNITVKNSLTFKSLLQYDFRPRRFLGCIPLSNKIVVNKNITLENLQKFSGTPDNLDMRGNLTIKGPDKNGDDFSMDNLTSINNLTMHGDLLIANIPKLTQLDNLRVYGDGVEFRDCEELHLLNNFYMRNNKVAVQGNLKGDSNSLFTVVNCANFEIPTEHLDHQGIRISINSKTIENSSSTPSVTPNNSPRPEGPATVKNTNTIRENTNAESRNSFGTVGGNRFKPPAQYQPSQYQRVPRERLSPPRGSLSAIASGGMGTTTAVQSVIYEPSTKGPPLITGSLIRRKEAYRRTGEGYYTINKFLKSKDIRPGSGIKRMSLDVGTLKKPPMDKFPAPSSTSI